MRKAGNTLVGRAKDCTELMWNEIGRKPEPDDRVVWGTYSSRVAPNGFNSVWDSIFKKIKKV